jgi:hypothetical protein
MDEIIKTLLANPEPSIRYRLAVDVLDQPQDSPEVIKLREEIRNSQRVLLDKIATQ